MAFQALESELAALRKQLSHFQAGLKSIEQRQKVRLATGQQDCTKASSMICEIKSNCFMTQKLVS